MSVDLFISYAWTSDDHRQWVRLLAAQLKVLGFDVLIDADLDYGDSLTGFMRKVVDARHVLMVVDDNYVVRANSRPGSGVAIENEWISGAFEERPSSWLCVLFKDNPTCGVPDWLHGHDPKGFDFNYDVSHPNDFVGAEQVGDIWRWIEGLPSNRDRAVPFNVLRGRAARIERVDVKADSRYWRSPDLSGQVRFMYRDSPSGTYSWGYQDLEFGFSVSECGSNSVYVYNDPIKAVGVVRDADLSVAALGGVPVSWADGRGESGGYCCADERAWRTVSR